MIRDYFCQEIEVALFVQSFVEESQEKENKRLCFSFTRGDPSLTGCHSSTNSNNALSSKKNSGDITNLSFVKELQLS